MGEAHTINPIWTVLQDWISEFLQESAKIERKVIKTNKEKLLWAHGLVLFIYAVIVLDMFLFVFFQGAVVVLFFCLLFDFTRNET